MPPKRVLSSLATVVSSLRELHRQRQDYHSAEKRLTLQIKAIQRRTHARAGCAKALHATCEGVYDIEIPATALLAQMRAPAAAQRKLFEREMQKAAKTLPVWGWAASVRGFGALGLGQIVAECGDLAEYGNPGKLWSRMGVGLGPNREAYYEGRSPRRRAILYCIGECLIKAGGGYKAVYDTRKAYESLRPPCRRQFKTGGECFDPETGLCRRAHLHARAKRFMEKRLLLDLWRAWRACTTSGEAPIVYPGSRSVSRSATLRRAAVAVAMALAPLACAGSGLAPSPSPVAAPPAGTLSAPAPAAAQAGPPLLPAGVDPAYVRSLAVVNAAGYPKRWAGGSFHHCYDPAVVPADLVDENAARMSAITGIARTEAGPCNVTWEVDPSMPSTIGARSILAGTETEIFTARIQFHTPYHFDRAEHETGHVMGLQHSSRYEDCMYGGARPYMTDFSSDELKVLGWVYSSGPR